MSLTKTTAGDSHSFGSISHVIRNLDMEKGKGLKIAIVVTEIEFNLRQNQHGKQNHINFRASITSTVRHLFYYLTDEFLGYHLYFQVRQPLPIPVPHFKAISSKSTSCSTDCNRRANSKTNLDKGEEILCR
jgi:hypothetical protein